MLNKIVEYMQIGKDFMSWIYNVEIRSIFLDFITCYAISNLIALLAKLG
jgi:hypothetical protein